MSVTDYSKTASSNTSIDSTDISEGCSPAGINNAIRSVMKDIAEVVDGTTAMTAFAVDNLKLDGNTLSSTDTNGDITLDPNGTGNVVIGNYEFDADQTVGSGQDEYILTYDNSTGHITLKERATPVHWYGELASNTTITRATDTTITGMTTDELDPDSAFDGSTFTVPTGKGGVYYVEGNVAHDFGDVGSDGEQVTCAIARNGTRIKQHNWLITGSDIYRASTQVSMLFNFSAGDTITLQVYHYDGNGGNGKIMAGKTHFSGFKLA
jgi:hypothetical protein